MNILIFRTDKLGDLIISTPVLGAIKARHPEARIMLVASPYNAVAVTGLPEIDQVLLYDKKMSAAQKYIVRQQIKAFRATHALVLSPKNDCFFMALLSGAKQRGGLLMEYRLLPRMLAPLLLTHSVFIPRDRAGEHQATRVLKLAEAMGLCPPGTFPYRIAHSAQARQVLVKNNITTRFIAVHLADKWLEENWRADDVKVFLGALSARTGLPCIATAGQADKALSAALKGTLPVLTNLTFHEWVAVMEAAALVVTPDCGAVHIACALQKPLLALYPPSRFTWAMAEFGPWGTVFRAHPLEAPATLTPTLLDDASLLLKSSS